MIASMNDFNAGSIFKQNYYGNDLLAHYYTKMKTFDDFLGIRKISFDDAVDAMRNSAPKWIIPRGESMKVMHTAHGIIKYEGDPPRLCRPESRLEKFNRLMELHNCVMLADDQLKELMDVI